MTPMTLNESHVLPVTPVSAPPPRGDAESRGHATAIRRCLAGARRGPPGAREGPPGAREGGGGGRRQLSRLQEARAWADGRKVAAGGPAVAGRNRLGGSGEGGGLEATQRLY